MVAIIVAVVALCIASISLAATGTIAIRLRLVTPRPHAASSRGLEPARLAAIGQPMHKLLAPLIDHRVQTADGAAILTDNFLLSDGPVLVTSTSCAACRYLIRDSTQLLTDGQVRLVVVGPSTERGIEFIETDCAAAGVSYIVDVGGEYARALTIEQFPTALTVTEGALATAHTLGTRDDLSKLLELSAKTPDVLLRRTEQLTEERGQ